MSDDIKQEQPSAGGSYVRQADGSLVRQEAPGETETSAAAPPARATKPTKGK